MRIIATVEEMQQVANEIRLQQKKICIIPTMGYFHEGHLSLVRIGKQNADIIVTTIFVNPAQFAPSEDFNNYPRNIERDKRLAESCGVDILFIPSVDEIYPRDYKTFIEVEQLTEVLEGKFRSTHFRGVTTVVAKLFNIIKPHVAIFGQKDAQQAIVIKKMVRDLNYGIDIAIAPIVRESDGLAMSSRNVYLNITERTESLILFQSLQLAKHLIENGERSCTKIISEMTKLITSKPSAKIDYISIADSETLKEYLALHSADRVLISLAVRIGKTRLIDNTLITI